MMPLSSCSFWAKLILVISTCFFAVSYISNPATNPCQMTFMMEPPRFVPVSIQEDILIDGNNHNYRLYMYSEMGFPHEFDLRTDLRDSMPALFIPGNAGSYQQVRSLASTCIRRQLKSLKANKFVFYTIDFQAQFSVLSGNLIAKQIEFVRAAIVQISRIHPSETNGVIMIGHSIGGFLSKAVLSHPNFNPSLVPMIINLASPLIRPYLNFDKKMVDIYEQTNSFWRHNSSNLNTVSVSISGGRLDRLVPLQTSLDPHYDISMTTCSIQNVWLTTDHVSITWCRELMYKLADLLSHLMDKKNNNLITDKKNLITRIEGNLLTKMHVPNSLKISTRLDFKIDSVPRIDDLKGSASISRTNLIEETIALDLFQVVGDELLIWIEHIDDLKEKGIFACSDLEFQANRSQTICKDSINLLQFVEALPSHRSEPRKSVIRISLRDLGTNYILINFRFTVNNRRNGIPEQLFFQIVGSVGQTSIDVPSMTQLIIKYMIGSRIKVESIQRNPAAPLLVHEISLENLVYESQYYKLKVESSNCQTRYSQSRFLTVLLFDGRYLKQAFHSEIGKSHVIVQIDSLKTWRLKHDETEDERRHQKLLLYLDGSCDTLLTLKYDCFAYIEVLIQDHLSEILALSSFLSHAMIMWRTHKYISPNLDRLSGFTDWFSWLVSCGLIHICAKRNPSLADKNWYQDIYSLESVVQLTVLILISSGLLYTVEYVFNRFVDLTVIINNIQIVWKENILKLNSQRDDNEIDYMSTQNNDEETAIRDHTGVYTCFISISIWELLVFTLIVLASLYYSQALISLLMLLMFMKEQVNLILLANSLYKCTSNRHLYDRRTVLMVKERLYAAQDLVSACSTLCLLMTLVNTPAALFAIHSTTTYFKMDNLKIESYHVVSVISTFLSRYILRYVRTARLERKLWPKMMSNFQTTNHLKITACALVVITYCYQDIRAINYVPMVSFVCLAQALANHPTRRASDQIFVEETNQ